MTTNGHRDERLDGPDERLRGLEAVLFVADEPLTVAHLAQVLETGRAEVEAALRALAQRYEETASGLAVRNVAGGWRLYTHPGAAPAVERFVLSSRHARLTKAALETLAIVAYKQPVTRHQIASIRGVNSDGVLRALVDRDLVSEVGRDDAPGRPVLYGTTVSFLERLGLASVGDLPSLAPLLADGAPGGAAEAGAAGRPDAPNEPGAAAGTDSAPEG